MIHSLYLEVEKRRGNEAPFSVGSALWRVPDLPSLQTFVDDVARLYGLIEPPFHVHRAWAEIVTDTNVMVVECDWPLDPPKRVAKDLWAKMVALPDVA